WQDVGDEDECAKQQAGTDARAEWAGRGRVGPAEERDERQHRERTEPSRPRHEGERRQVVEGELGRGEGRSPQDGSGKQEEAGVDSTPHAATIAEKAPPTMAR